MSKQYAVMGLGRFGTAVALGLAESGNEVTAVDSNEERVQAVADVVTYSAVADVTKKGVCESLGIGNAASVCFSASRRSCLCNFSRSSVCLFVA